MPPSTLYRRIVGELSRAGQASPYAADANEPDPRYLGYGVRAPEMRRIIGTFKSELKVLGPDAKLAMASRLIESGYGEQKTIALHLLEQMPEYFTPARFAELERVVRGLQGWSKIDTCTGALLRLVLDRHPHECLELLWRWVSDDDLWMRRASVVIFTRKVAQSGLYTDHALKHCEQLKHDREDMVRKGVGWCLKDLMRVDKKRVLDYVISLREQQVSSVITLYALRDIKGAEREKLMGS